MTTNEIKTAIKTATISLNSELSWISGLKLHIPMD
jgi:hypothetical protein